MKLCKIGSQDKSNKFMCALNDDRNGNFDIFPLNQNQIAKSMISISMKMT